MCGKELCAPWKYGRNGWWRTPKNDCSICLRLRRFAISACDSPFFNRAALILLAIEPLGLFIISPLDCIIHCKEKFYNIMFRNLSKIIKNDIFVNIWVYIVKLHLTSKSHCGIISLKIRKGMMILDNRPITMIERRMDKGLSQSELAHRCGLSRASINSYECGRATPPVSTAKRIAHVLDMPWTQIFEGC